MFPKDFLSVFLLQCFLLADLVVDVQANGRVELQGGFNSEDVECDYIENDWDCTVYEAPQRCWYTYDCRSNDQLWDLIGVIRRYYSIETRQEAGFEGIHKITVFSIQDHDEVKDYLAEKCYGEVAVCSTGADKLSVGSSVSGSQYVKQTDLLSLSRNCPAHKPCNIRGGCKKMYKNGRRWRCPRN